MFELIITDDLNEAAEGIVEPVSNNSTMPATPIHEHSRFWFPIQPRRR